MPLYDYKCAQHGHFQELAEMANHAKPAPCPQCGQLAGRVIRIPSAILNMDPNLRQAHDRNEKSRHEPLISTKDQRQHDHKHASACGCGKDMKSAMLYLADGSKIFPSDRPWMISH